MGLHLSEWAWHRDFHFKLAPLQGDYIAEFCGETLGCNQAMIQHGKD